MKTHLVVLACVAALALAAPVEYDSEYDPDCVEDDGDYLKEVEPLFGEEDALPALGEPDIKIPIDDLANAEEECEDATIEPDNGAAPEDPCDLNPCAAGCSDDCSVCPDLPQCQEETTYKPETESAVCEDEDIDPCATNPCGDGCEQDCGLCPDQPGCAAPTNPPVDPCDVDVCQPGCEQPCSECSFLDKCQEATTAADCVDPLTDAPVTNKNAPSNPPKPETTQAPETAGTDECVDVTDEIETVKPNNNANACAANPCADGCEEYAEEVGIQDCGWKPMTDPPVPSTEECVDEELDNAEPAVGEPILKNLVIEPAKQEPDSVLIDTDFGEDADLGAVADEDCEEEVY